MKTQANPQAVIDRIVRRNKIEAYIVAGLSTVIIIASVFLI